jgi:hypothetical protein
MTDQRCNAAYAAREFGQCGIAIAIKTIPEQKVLGRVATDREFRCQNEICTGLPGALAVFDDFCGIACQIAHDAVDLRNCNFH